MNKNDALKFTVGMTQPTFKEIMKDTAALKTENEALKKRIDELQQSNTKACEEMTRLQQVIIDMNCPFCPYDCKGNRACSQLHLSKQIKDLANEREK